MSCRGFSPPSTPQSETGTDPELVGKSCLPSGGYPKPRRSLQPRPQPDVLCLGCAQVWAQRQYPFPWGLFAKLPGYNSSFSATADVDGFCSHFLVGRPAFGSSCCHGSIRQSGTGHLGSQKFSNPWRPFLASWVRRQWWEFRHIRIQNCSSPNMIH